MTQAEIMAMATEAEISLEIMVLLCGVEIQVTASPLSVDELARFAALVAAKEREACAQVCDRVAQDAALSNRRRCDADALARSIRARGQQEGV